MTEVQKDDKRGTVKDWPFEVAILLGLVALAAGGAPALQVLLVVCALGSLVLWLARRGAFSPRGR